MPNISTKWRLRIHRWRAMPGASLDSEEMWFNQVANSPLPAYKKAWFTSTNFRRAISEAINREDIARIVFRGHAHPAVGTGVSRQQILVQRQAASASFRSEIRATASGAGWIPSSGRRLARSRRTRGRVLRHHECRKQVPRTHGDDDPAGSVGHRNQAERGHPGFPVADRTHHPAVSTTRLACSAW